MRIDRPMAFEISLALPARHAGFRIRSMTFIWAYVTRCAGGAPIRARQVRLRNANAPSPEETPEEETPFGRRQAPVSLTTGQAAGAARLVRKTY